LASVQIAIALNLHGVLAGFVPETNQASRVTVGAFVRIGTVGPPKKNKVHVAT
jgi:hypothetical protein